MCYEVVQVPGGYEKATPRWRGFEFTGLGKGDVVIGKGHLGGDMRITNCGRATIVIDSFVAAPLVIEGAEPVRDGGRLCIDGCHRRGLAHAPVFPWGSVASEAVVNETSPSLGAATSTSSPAGQPSRTAVNPGPCDSPAVR